MVKPDRRQNGSQSGSSSGFPRRYRICHVINSLNAEGAQVMLLNVLRRIDRGRFEPEVISLSDSGAIGRELRAFGVPVRALHLHRGGALPKLLRAVRWVRRSNPDLLQSWLYHANFVAAVIARLAGNIPLVWGIHHGRIVPHTMKALTRAVVRTCSLLSRHGPRAIIYVAESAEFEHVRMGFSPSHSRVICNGVDTDRFKPDAEARRRLRACLGLASDVPVIGLVARFVPDKDHQTFVRAARRVRARVPNARFILCGQGVVWENSVLSEWLRTAGLEECSYLLGPRTDVPAILAACDVAVLSSASEASPLVLCEAMACAVPCVVTGVGDAAEIVGTTGCVVPPRDPEQLADAISYLATLEAPERVTFGSAARRRVQASYNINTTASRYCDVWTEVLG